MTDAGTHVPLIANWPGTIPEGQVKNELIDFSDFLPTMMEASNTDIPKDLKIDGQSFLPQLRGEKGNPRGWVHCWYRRGNEKPQQWARTQRYKLYKTEKFYDVSKDRLESNPLQKLNTDQKRIKEMPKSVLTVFWFLQTRRKMTSVPILPLLFARQQIGIFSAITIFPNGPNEWSTCGQGMDDYRWSGVPEGGR